MEIFFQHAKALKVRKNIQQLEPLDYGISPDRTANFFKSAPTAILRLYGTLTVEPDWFAARQRATSKGLQ